MEPNKRFKKAFDYLCSATMITYDDMMSKCRKHEIVVARQLMASALWVKGYRLKNIAEALNVTHSAVLHGVDTFDNLIATDRDHKNLYGPIYNRVLDLVTSRGGAIKDGVYLCGKVTGIEYEEALEKFNSIMKELKRSKFQKIFNPLAYDKYMENNFETNKRCFYHMLSCKYIYVLPDACECEQARLEMEVAKNIGLTFLTEQDLYY